MKIAVVVQRYGADINGGAELHARYIAERLGGHADVDVLTTCARDYVTWRNERAEGLETINGIRVRRFPVVRERDVLDFGRRSERIFQHRHSVHDELAWLDSEGPTAPALITYIRRHAAAYDYFIFFSYRYYHAFHGVRAVADRALLVPTAERDPAVGVSIFHGVFRGVRAIMYNSPEERAMIRGIARNERVPGVVVGVGSEVPAHTDPERFRQAFGIDGPFAVFVGRIDENKGCKELFSFFLQYARGAASRLSLVLIGTSILPIPDHPRVRHLGFLADRDKFDAIRAADLLIMPSYYESLSMVALEAWALGRPVLANGACDVLKGQCVRSKAGLYYEGFEEFVETLDALESNQSFRAALGANGRAFFTQHYDWPVIERKYLDMLEQLRRADAGGRAPAALEALPGWFARRRRDVPAAAETLAAVPAGAVTGADAA